jgi:transcription antitermination factor NusG
MNPTPSDVRWHVLRVKPRSEKKVEQKLTQLGFEACVPTQKTIQKWSDRRKTIEKILFNNYVFVATGRQRRNEVFQVQHVNGYLNFGGQVAVLSEKEVVLIKKLSHWTQPVQITYDQLKVGDEIEIVEGNLAGLRGKVIALNGISKVQLALPTLNCFANIEVKAVELKKITKQ